MDKEIMGKKYEAPMLSWVRMELEQVIAASPSGEITAGGPALDDFETETGGDFNIQF